MSKAMDKIKLISNQENQKLLPRKKLKALIFLSIVGFIGVLYYTSSSRISKTDDLEKVHSLKDYDDENEVISVRENSVKSNVTKNILFWTRFFNNSDWYTGKDDAGEEVLRSVQCPVTNCFFTHNKELLGDIKKFDVIAFHGPEFRRKPLPTVRSPHQLYIFVSLESPTAVLDDLKQYKNFYNLTMTYRLDSDIEFDYGKVIDVKTNKIVAPSVDPIWKVPDENFYDEEMLKKFQSKGKSIAWFVSNCYTRSNRRELVANMQSLIDIDIYGRCGRLKCPVDSQECLDMLTADYKFYLSFENSLCKDYITEKLYRPLTQYIIPIVFNGGNTSKFAPPKSYINANDYETVEDLVKYLKFLMDNPKEYVKFFWWKQHYSIKSHPTFPYTLCDMCMKLNNVEFMHSRHSYDDIDLWFRPTNMCNQMSRIKFHK